MPIIFACHECGQPYKRPSKDAGKKAKCAKCEADLIVPAATQELVAAAISVPPLPPPASPAVHIANPNILAIVLVTCGALMMGYLVGRLTANTPAEVTSRPSQQSPQGRFNSGGDSLPATPSNVKDPRIDVLFDRMQSADEQTVWQLKSIRKGEIGDFPDEIGVVAKHPLYPIEVSFDGLPSGLDAVYVTIRPFDPATPEGRQMVLAAVKTLASIAEFPAKQVLAWVKYNQTNLSDKSYRRGSTALHCLKIDREKEIGILLWAAFDFPLDYELDEWTGE